MLASRSFRDRNSASVHTFGARVPSNPGQQRIEPASHSAHNCRMSTITQTTVVFSCPKCGLNYQATQEHSSDQSSGSFDCKNCKTNVLKSSGVYDYSNYSRWTPVPK